MAKNKFFLTVLVVLLAGCAVLLGCAGEGADDVSKSGDNSMSVSDNSGEEIPFEPSGLDPETDNDGQGENNPVEGNDPIGKNPGKPIFPVLPPQELGTFPGLDVETERLVKLDYLNYLGRSFGWSVAGLYDRTFDQIRILRYYGTYNGCVVVIMDADDLFYAQVNTFITVAGLKFGWGDSNVARVWKRGESPSSGNFYRLNEAYDLGVLSLEDIKNLHGRYFDYPYEEKESPPMPDHLCDFYGQKIPNCNFDGCDW